MHVLFCLCEVYVFSSLLVNLELRQLIVDIKQLLETVFLFVRRLFASWFLDNYFLCFLFLRTLGNGRFTLTVYD